LNIGCESLSKNKNPARDLDTGGALTANNETARHGQFRYENSIQHIGAVKAVDGSDIFHVPDGDGLGPLERHVYQTPAGCSELLCKMNREPLFHIEVRHNVIVSAFV
jgi:hypothetical protein